MKKHRQNNKIKFTPTLFRDTCKVEVKNEKEVGEAIQVANKLKNIFTFEEFERIREQQIETPEQIEELRIMIKEAGIDDNDLKSEIDDIEAEIVKRELDKVNIFMYILIIIFRFKSTIAKFKVTLTLLEDLQNMKLDLLLMREKHSLNNYDHTKLQMS